MSRSVGLGTVNFARGPSAATRQARGPSAAARQARGRASLARQAIFLPLKQCRLVTTTWRERERERERDLGC